ncbi:putative outer membrane protein [Pedobacter sp. BAL39]|uniref:SusC/RagA family TonB-linked outer membrane protein n=1 Tax=Pedobacter sp. BAL39 TaxID=391596 RepID=UPI0001559A23|nr:SusC/RagA family TonB-linked outer membrane protein [Pedobacter sp. BAL39]EDM36257.1 putative outer membrane protein [Pedobacter sp. BAL39]
MRLTTVILIASFLQVSASTFGQRINISRKNVPLESVLKEIRKQSGYDFYYDGKTISADQKINVSITNLDVDHAVKAVLNGLNLRYNIEGTTVSITRSEPSLLKRVLDRFSAIDVRGRVVDKSGKALPGANIIAYPGRNRTTPDANGVFFMAGIVETATLEISHVGYVTKRLKAKPDMEDIVLELNDSKLDEVQIIGYGTESRRLSVGSTFSVQADAIEKQPISNPLAALEGLVPGLNITPTSGAPGAGIKVQVRGQNSLSQIGFGQKPYDQPLFVIDGVPTAAQNVNINSLSSFGGGDGTLSFGGMSPFNNLNPSDIESITILKDISATAIYGTQGANGVILITTKKGKAGKTKLQATFNTAVNSASRKYELLNLDQYLAYRREALANDGVNLSTASPLAYPDLLLFDQDKSTDWVDYYLSRTARNTDAHVSLSGGSDRITFLISPGYNKSEYNFNGNFYDQRFTLHSNLNYASPDNRFTVDFGFDYSYERNNSAASPSLVSSILTPPNFPDLYTAEGKPNWNYKGYNTSQFVQYSAALKQPSLLNAYNLKNSLALGYRIVEGLKFNINLGYNRLLSNEDQQIPASTINPRNNPVSSASFTTNTFETINIEPQLNYQRNFGKGIFTALLGGTYKKNNVSRIQLNGTRFSDEALLGSIASAATIQATDSYNPYKYIGAFARLGYTYDSKYIVQVSGRRDGSSNFGVGRKYADFGAVGLGWIFSEERFFKFANEVISYGKLSGSYGTVGTDATSPYQYQQLFTTNTSMPDFQGVRPLYVQNLYNPDYGWDTKKSLNLGLDLGFFKERVLLNLTYYRDRTGNQLVNYSLPSQTGFSSVLSNFPAVVQNKGLEFNLTSKNITTQNFSWNTSFNISANRNKLIAFPGLAESAYAALYTIGESVNIEKGYRLKGVNSETGFFEFYKSDGSVTSDPVYGIPSEGGDLQTIANTAPKFIGGLGNTISYKRFSLYFHFQFQRKQQANYLRSLYANTRPGAMYNQPVEILDRWTKQGDVASIQKFTRGFNMPAYYFTMSSGAYSDGSYVRLRTAALSYTLPTGFSKKLGISDGKLYVNGQNLFLLTNYKVGDPELTDIFSFPIQRTINFGLTINL